MVFAETINVSMAICCIWSWLIPHFYIEYMEFRLALSKRTRTRIRTNSNNGQRSFNDSNNITAINSDDNNDGNNNNESRFRTPQQQRRNRHHPSADDDRDSHSISSSVHHEEQEDDLLAYDDSNNNALLQGAATAVFIIILIYVGSAIGVGLTTRNMDSRANAIVIGLGRIFSAFLFAVFSVEIPQWLGVTYSSHRRGNYYKFQQQQSLQNQDQQTPMSPTSTNTTTIQPTATTLKELSFRVCWSILGHFFVMYFILLLYFCNSNVWTIPISTAIGVAFGFGVVWAVWIGSTRYKNHTTYIAIVFALTIAISSAAAFSAGCYYIKEVWYSEDDIGYQEEYTLITFFGWLGLCILANLIYYRLTRRKLKQAGRNGPLSTTIDGNSTAAAQDWMAGVANSIDMARSGWRFQPQVFQPPESVCFAATELSKATATVAVATVKSPFQKAGTALTRIRSSSFASGGGGSSHHNTPRRRRNSEEVEDNLNIGRHSLASPRSPHTAGNRSNHSTAPNATASQYNRLRINTEATVTSTASSVISSSTNNNRRRSYSETSKACSSLNAEDHNHRDDENDDDDNLSRSGSPNSLDGLKTDLDQDFLATRDEGDPEQAENESRLDTSDVESFHDIFDTRPSIDVEETIPEVEEEQTVKAKDPSLWYMIKTNSCCGRRHHYKAPPRKRWQIGLNFLKWSLWGITSGMHLYLAAINIGATLQQNRVRAALPGTFEMLYPDNYNVGAMCAWDEASPDGNIKTFDSLEDVYAANYSVIHCGDCGACSNWNDLRLQWTTRTYLAEEGQKCVQEVLFGGSVDDVQQCNEQHIGFTEECSTCWTVDQLCAKENCVFIYLQSFVVNQVSNFNVDPDAITTATCDEALCGPEFVPCSGATRRRMNIVSDIPRPRDQQCTVANADWSEVFNHP